MPESDNALKSRFHAAVSAVEERWRQLSMCPQRLGRKELLAYRNHEPAMGWRFPIQFSDLQRRVDILIPESFPFSPARIALVDRPDFLTWPHVERDGVLCLLQSHGTISIDEPDGGIGVLLGLAFDLVERCVKGKLDEDFKGEFRSYWMNSATTPERPGPYRPRLSSCNWTSSTPGFHILIPTTSKFEIYHLAPLHLLK